MSFNLRHWPSNSTNRKSIEAIYYWKSGCMDFAPWVSEWVGVREWVSCVWVREIGKFYPLLSYIAPYPQLIVNNAHTYHGLTHISWVVPIRSFAAALAEFVFFRNNFHWNHFPIWTTNNGQTTTTTKSLVQRSHHQEQNNQCTTSLLRLQHQSKLISFSVNKD